MFQANYHKNLNKIFFLEIDIIYIAQINIKECQRRLK